MFRTLHDAAKTINPDVLVLCHGGPIAEPGDAAFVLKNTRGIAGFFGASSIERLPTEAAITDCVRRFKGLLSRAIRSGAAARVARVRTRRFIVSARGTERPPGK